MRRARLPIILFGLLALWAVPFVVQGLGVSGGGGGGGCSADCTFTGQNKFTGGSSGGTPSPSAELVIEDDAAPMLELLSPSTQIQYITFSMPGSAGMGSISYDHATNRMLFVTNGLGHWRLLPDGVWTPTSTGAVDIGSPTLQVREIYTNTIQPGAIDWISYTLASWGLASDSPTTTFRCSDCNPGTAPCTAGGTGAIASSLNNIWRCP